MRISFEQLQHLAHILLELKGKNNTIKEILLNNQVVYDIERPNELNDFYSTKEMLEQFFYLNGENDKDLYVSFSDGAYPYTVSVIMRKFLNYLQKIKVLYVITEVSNCFIITFFQ